MPIENEQSVEQIRLLASELVQRIHLARAMGLTHDGNRDLYGVLGYEEKLTSQMYRARYERGGIAGRAVDALPKATWRGDGELVENDDPEQETQFETEWWEMNDRVKIWSIFQRADILAQLDNYSVVLIGAPGEFNTELPLGSPEKLLYLTPFAKEYVTIPTYETDSQNPRFGKPTAYLLKRSDANAPELQKPIHHSRVVHIPSEGYLDDDQSGPPTLQAVWNYINDLEKVVGGGAEAFWLRANQGLHLDIDKDMALPDAKNAVEALKAQAEEYKHQLTRWLRTRGVKATTLGSDTADFSNPADAILTLIAGTIGVPKRILTGSEMGELASTQDRDNWHDQINDRRTAYAGPVVVRQLIDRLIKYKYISKPKEYSVRWPTIQNLNDIERIETAAKAAAMNEHGEIIMTGDEIRDKYLGLEPLEEDEKHPKPPEGTDPEKEQIDKLEAALRKGGVLNLVVRGTRETPTAAPPRAAAEHLPPSIVINNPEPRRLRKTFTYGDVDGKMRPVGVVEEEA